MTIQDDVFRGCLPALMTPIRNDGSVDFDTLVETATELVDAGMTGVVYCGSMGDWPLIADADRREGVRRLVNAGIKVVVGTGATNPQSAVELARHASEVGAAGLMMIPRLLSRSTSVAAQRDHFRSMLAAAPTLPAVIYNSPYYGYQTRAELYFELRSLHPNLVGFKEFGGAASLSYAGEHITSAPNGGMLLVGVDTQVYHGFVQCGAVGAITGIGNCLPQPVLCLVELSRQAAAGDANARAAARELSEALMVLSSFDEGVDLVLYYRHLAVAMGKPAYQLPAHASDQLSPSQKNYATSQLELFLQWWKLWSPTHK
jgi:1-pyrroline-4-hydroxy-2-carboxylate deaminase